MNTLQMTVTAFLLFSVPGLNSQDKSPRGYFEEIKNAGGFMHTVIDVEGKKHSAPDTGYVCFAENNSATENAGVFLTFMATAYDKYYAEAQKVLESNAGAEEKRKALATIEAAQDREPYVGFLTDDFMPLLPADAAEFYHKGGEMLELSLYMHGVKTWTESLHRFNFSKSWDSTNHKMDFAVEASTMRFLWSVHGDKPQVINGRCEKIYKETLSKSTNKVSE
jgi:hypothetical protein